MPAPRTRARKQLPLFPCHFAIAHGKSLPDCHVSLLFILFNSAGLARRDPILNVPGENWTNVKYTGDDGLFPSFASTLNNEPVFLACPQRGKTPARNREL